MFANFRPKIIDLIWKDALYQLNESYHYYLELIECK